MTRTLKIHWALWTFLVVVLATGAIAFELSSPTHATIELRPKKTIDVSVFRPLPHALRLSLRFKITNGQLRPELGEWRTEETGGYLEFQNPGAAIKLLVRAEGKEVIYEALPTDTGTRRSLVPFVDDGNLKRFKWPPNSTMIPILPSGYSSINITVLDVDPQLVGEQVALTVMSPISFKSVAQDYGFIWWFMFWPLYALLLVGYGLVLFWQTRRHNCCGGKLLLQPKK